MTDDSLEDRWARCYTEYWESAPDYEGYETRWEQLRTAVAAENISLIAGMLRDMYEHGFKAGFMLRLTGE